MELWQGALKQIKRVIFDKKLAVNSFQGFFSLFLVGISLSVLIAACSGGDTNNSANSGSSTSPGASPVAANKQDVEVTLVSFAVTKAAHEAIIPKFVENWKKEHNQTVTFKQSYGGSGSQTRAVIDGLEADVVHLSLAGDVQKIEKAGLIQPGWEKEVPNNAIVSKSVAALVTRDGNPKGIKTWSDLAKDNVKLISADPKTSGIARWNFLALWNSVIKTGGDEAKATDFVTKVFKNVPVLTKDAREASDTFLKQGQGDALINYENEVLLAQKKGAKLNYIVPDVNISIDNPIAVVDKNVDKHGTREVAEAFVKYLFTAEAQQEFAKIGFRPVDETLAQTKSIADKYPKVKNLGTVNDYGGWSAVDKKFFADGALFDKLQVKNNKK
ncbi:sulfate ABC transporter substrate-binding protein [Aetokthonos hydrillicola Thurmond2011]|jgi:sulfate transport system substrate-binding protein|uniref:Sulfate ABC transporter substrate-binding protein n=1 Tax=Aetokthonos hydrillicola Thurmond2011 TaxID=2712845 RepID=A0AAP5IB63_9CYAN|nr:sulfate ABC transporter substrate-binding protein [Aetokthonos hydrillicola]MBO3462562.1 sulfate ABC transporter substrate-binding protein [Aetokthonos hydrillicola CCALA 1050]MBW4590350.1 sulfate ABC transporter substrate-binding protein [Aetokthonos hydrillicola CCALA 1050]MDR9896892.1 sulfate ABC transporter substrate-binding protein [Aetokthonos hydrillicola Thurmond2011]